MYMHTYIICMYTFAFSLPCGPSNIGKARGQPWDTDVVMLVTKLAENWTTLLKPFYLYVAGRIIYCTVIYPLVI